MRRVLYKSHLNKSKEELLVTRKIFKDLIPGGLKYIKLVL